MTEPVGSRGARPRTSFYSGTPVISVIGEVELTTAPADGAIVDLTCCNFLDARGLRALIATRDRLERSNRQLALVLPNPSAPELFRCS
jgi:anti-anti-sigma regulatory factor